MKRKITEISVYEFFMCMFVIAIHLLSEGVDAFPKWSVSSIVFMSLTKLMTFAVPGFVFTSAIKLFYKYGERKFNYPKFLLGRFLRVYLPYMIAVVVYYVVFVYAMRLDGFNRFDWGELGWFILRGDISAQFYFVVLIMQFYILMPLWVLITKIKSNIFGITLIIVSLVVTVLSRMYFPTASLSIIEWASGLKLPFANPISTEGVSVITLAAYTNKFFTSYLIFWIAGMYIGLNYDRFVETVKAAKPVIYVGWFILAISHCILSYMQHGGLIQYSFSSIIVVLFCIFSIFGFYIYAENLTVSLENMGKGFLTSISNASYDIYLIHCLIISVLYYYMGHIELESTMQKFWIATGVTYSLSIILCVLKTTIQTNIKLSYRKASAERARKASRRKRYL